MGKLEERESRRRSIVGGMVEAAPTVPTTGSQGRPKADREL